MICKVFEYIAISIWTVLMCGQSFSVLKTRKGICKVLEYIAMSVEWQL